MVQGKREAREAAMAIIERLRDAGHVAYLAGGCVRDTLLEIAPKDYDIATEARPKVVRALFSRSRYVGESFGVVLVYQFGHQIEVATFRTEWGYADGRRPDEVAFSDAEHDAQRRDFTINGLFGDPLAADEKNSVIDYVNGQADIRAKLIRAIGDPAERFGEDYLRMLRAVRFAARLGFKLEDNTAASIPPLAGNLAKISRERIGQEVLAMFAGARPARAAKLMQELALDGPTLEEAHQDGPVAILDALSSEAGAAAALTAWMLDRHAGATTIHDAAAFVGKHAKVILSRWRLALNLSNQFRDELRHLLGLLVLAADWPQLGVAARKRLLACSDAEQAVMLVRAIDRHHAELIEAEAGPLRAAGVDPEPMVTGDDLIDLGFEPGPQVGELLDSVYDLQLEGRVTCRSEALEWLRGERGQGAEGSGAE